MKKKKIRRYSAAGVVLALLGLGWLASHQGSASPSGSTSKTTSRQSAGDDAGESEETTSAHLAAKAGERPQPVPHASEEEKVKFRHFFLPPMDFDDATLEEALARLVAVYRETALATGETPQNLKFDLSAAATGKLFTGQTPRGTASAVLRYLAMSFDNRVAGELPAFKLVALDNVHNLAGNMQVPPDLIGRLIENAGTDEEIGIHDKLKPGDILRRLGIGDESSEIDFHGDSLSYKNLSTADLAKLGNFTEDSIFSLGPFQAKTTVQTLIGPDSMLLPGDRQSLTPQELQEQLRAASLIKGVALENLPGITSRSGEPATIEIIKELPAPDGGQEQPWTGTRFNVNSVPLGLGSQVSINYESRSEGQEPVVIQQQVNVPENGSSVGVAHLQDGQALVILPRVSLIDATGRPLWSGKN